MRITVLTTLGLHALLKYWIRMLVRPAHAYLITDHAATINKYALFCIFFLAAGCLPYDKPAYYASVQTSDRPIQDDNRSKSVYAIFADKITL